MRSLQLICNVIVGIASGYLNGAAPSRHEGQLPQQMLVTIVHSAFDLVDDADDVDDTETRLTVDHDDRSRSEKYLSSRPETGNFRVIDRIQFGIKSILLFTKVL